MCRPRSPAWYLYIFLDYVLATTVVTPLVVLYWRCIWMLEDTYMLPQYPLVSGWVSVAVGFLIVFWCQLMQEVLDGVGRKNYGLFMLVSRIYSMVMGVGVVTQWRGLWALEDLYFDITVQSALWTLVVASAAITLAGGLSTVGNAVPFVFLPDYPDTYFLSPSRFGTKSMQSLCRYFWDSAFTIFVIQALAISCWRGLWTLLDFTIYPNNPRLSAVVSLESGGLATLLLLVSQPIARAIARQLGTIWRRVFEGAWNIAVAYAAVSVWRGIWMLIDEYFLEDVTCFAIGALVSVCALQTLYTGNSVHTKGIVVDGQTDDDSDIMFPINFFHSFMPTESYVTAKLKEDPEKEAPTLV
ncbi:uncharacterized protein LOC135396966 [Ornithodoros turicata]|uniref:uncharacterized protein LOC135396966 n=1 Tax=Ornithodoros turicata TaxID=34597 RepID=UPI003138A73D